MFLEDFRNQREVFEKLGKNAPRLAARPPNSYLAENGETQRRILLRQNIHQSDAEISNDWYRNSLCGHLRWVRAGELKIRSYTVKANGNKLR
jgi:hypothetical protein